MNRRQVNKLMAAAAASIGNAAFAQIEKPISIVVGYSAGGSADYTARVVADALGRKLGRTVVVDNIAGASGMLALQKTLNGPADGGMVYMAGTDTVLIPMVNPRVKHDWTKDFVCVGRMTTVPMVFAVPGDAPYNSLTDLLAALRKQPPNSFSYATPGIGTMQHLYGELINKRANVQMLHVPYRGGAQIATDLVGKQLQGAMLVLSTALPFVKDGRIKGLSVSGNERVAQMPNVKRIGEEEGFKGVSLPLWQGLMVKAGTHPKIVSAYESALMQVLAQPEVVKKLADGGIASAPMTGQQLKAFVTLQAATYREIVNAARISLE